MPIFGCVADDFTGASDAASFLVKGGMSVQLFNGIPAKESRIAEGIQAIVIALKSRTQDTGEAVADTMRSLGWLKEQGVEKFYLKYCSTFDSTPEGNIGPVADAAMEFLGVSYTVLCPALPVNGRVVRNGELYVGGVPLHESPMKNHPLTPMWDSRIAGLMKPQSKYPCVELWKEQMDRPADEIRAMLTEQEDRQEHFYVIPDYRDMEDGERIVEFVRENWGIPVLVYSSDTARNVKEVQQYGQERVAEMLEQAAAKLAERAVAHGIRRVVVAGGETSGAVTKRLGFSSYQIGASVAPGVPVMVPMENETLRLVLKSGNFGQEEFFIKVLEMTRMEEGK